MGRIRIGYAGDCGLPHKRNLRRIADVIEVHLETYGITDAGLAIDMARHAREAYWKALQQARVPPHQAMSHALGSVGAAGFPAIAGSRVRYRRDDGTVYKGMIQCIRAGRYFVEAQFELDRSGEPIGTYLGHLYEMERQDFVVQP